MSDRALYQFIVTYRGDVTKTLTACGTKCPFRLTPEGNTEQVMHVNRGLGSAGYTDQSFMNLTEQLILKDCKKVGEIISQKWIVGH
jgi:hypothetical protein